jgi:hypothetical protein
MTIDPITGLIQWIPTSGGSYDVTVEAANIAGTDQQDFTIQVGGCDYIVGDVNNSGGFNGVDVVFAVAYFKGGTIPSYSCECTSGNSWFVAGDVNGSCTFNGVDVVYAVAYFKGGPAPIPCPDCPPTVAKRGSDSDNSIKSQSLNK